MKKWFVLPSFAALLVVAGAVFYPTSSPADTSTVPTTPVAAAASVTTPLQVSFILPDAPIVSGPWVVLSATSTDNASVEFKYQKNQSGAAPISLGIDTTPERQIFSAGPTGVVYSKIWDTTSVENGNYVLYAIARDAAGNSTTTQTNVKVIGKAPFDAGETFKPGTYGDTKITASTQFIKTQNGIQTFLWAATPNMSAVYNYFPYITKEFDYVWFAQGTLITPKRDIDYAGVYSFDNLFATIKSMKALNRKIRAGIYAGHGGTMSPWIPPFANLRPADYLHDPSGNTILIRHVKPFKEQFLNIDSPATRQRLVEFWKQTLVVHPEVDGLFLDGYASYALDKGFQGFGKDGRHDPGLGTRCKEGECTTLAYWVGALSAYSTALRQGVTIPRGGDVIYNGLNSAPNRPAAIKYGGDLNRGWMQWNDGALLERAHELYASPSLFNKYVEDIKLSTEKNKKIFFYVQSQHLNAPRLYPNLVWKNDLQLEQFFLASFLLIEQKPLTYFFYNPGVFYRINRGVYYYSNWNYDYGSPTEAYVMTRSGLYSRNFTNGIVVVNPTSGPLTFAMPTGKQYRVWDPSGATLASGTISIPAKTGVYYFVIR